MAIYLELPVLHSDSDLGGERAPGHPGSIREARGLPLSPSRAAQIAPIPKPSWLKIRPPGGENHQRIQALLRANQLHTVCEEAHCPNVAECWAGGTATFMLGGDTCTRACRFCAIKTARRPSALNPEEPVRVGQSIAALGLDYVVLTAVDRDDLADGGAEHFAATIRQIKCHAPQIFVEALVPDFRGDLQAVATLVESGVDVYAHNVETVEALQFRVRDSRASYLQSLGTLIQAKHLAVGRSSRIYTKTSLMLGLGEREEEIHQTFVDLRGAGVDVLTLGQYLRPSPQHLPVERYYEVTEFARLREQAMALGFLYVAAGPLVRSSYRAGEFFLQGLLEQERASHGVGRIS